MSGLFGFVKGLLGYNAQSVIKPIYGSLFQSNKCLFNTCQLEVMKTGQFEYKLVVKRVIQEEEQVDEEERQSYVFPLLDEMNFSLEPPIAADHAYSWRDVLSNGQRFIFEFSEEENGEEDSNSQNLAKDFELAICRSLYESRYQTPSSEADLQDLKQFIKGNSSPNSPIAKKAEPKTPKKTPKKEEKSSSTPLRNEFQSPLKSELATPKKLEETFKTPEKTPKKEEKKERTPIRTNPKVVLPTQYPSTSETKEEHVSIPVASVILQVEAQLYQFNATQNLFEPREEVFALIKSFGDNKSSFHFMLTLLKKSNKELIFSQGIKSEMNMTYFDKEHSVIWLYKIGNHVWTWSLLFSNEEEEDQFKKTFHEKLWEENAQKPFNKLKEEEQEYIHQSIRQDVEMQEDDGLKDVDMLDFQEEDAVDSEDEEESEEEEEESEEEEEESEDEEETDEGIKGKNSLLTVGTKNQRSFVARGSKIGVFGHTDDNGIEFKTTINRLQNAKGEYFTPKKMVLHEGEQSLLMLNEGQKDVVMKLDLNRPDIVEEWKTGPNHHVNDLFHKTKLSQMDNEALVMGLNRMGFMTIDPRTKEKIVPEMSYNYSASTKPGLSCVATSERGQMAVGSEKGEIRMFGSKLLNTPKKDFDSAPRANTSLPGFGDPILGIDVSKDGKWILATCKTYLLVVPAEFGEGKNGFDSRMGKEKPAPRRLQLKNEHVAMMGGKVEFTTAKFNVTEGKEEETAIVTSTGHFVVAWNFRKVKQNQLNHYQIKQYDETVVGDQFRFGDDKSIVVATPQNVQMAKRAVKTYDSVTSPFRQSSPFKTDPVKRG